MRSLVLCAAALLSMSLPFCAQESIPEPTQNTEVAYRLFRTQNIYTLLKLDTRTGSLWQLQWNTDDKKRFVVPIYLWGQSPCPSNIPAGSICQPKPLRGTSGWSIYALPDPQHLYLHSSGPRWRAHLAGSVGRKQVYDPRRIGLVGEPEGHH